MLRRGGRLLVVSLALVAGCGLQARESTTTARRVDAQQTAETDATDLGTTDQPTTTLPEPTTTTAAPSTTAAPPTTPAPTTPPTTTPPTLPPTVPATAAPTMPPPPPQPFVGAPAGCDPNYTPCVPIDSDVDCAGGKGNGPSYVRGPVTVIGDDIYGLDRDGDGIGCE